MWDGRREDMKKDKIRIRKQKVRGRVKVNFLINKKDTFSISAYETLSFQMSEKQLLNKIELVRNELIKSAQYHGYHDEKTIRTSKYLDGLIIKIQKHYSKSKSMAD
jgi:hypothetical protein